MILMKMAWRNLWRNPRRTLITVFSMAFGLTMMIVSYCLMEGMFDQMVRYATLLGSGHIQVHHPDYLEDRSLYDTIQDPGGVLEAIAGTGVGPSSPRSFATALISSGPQSAGGILWGIDPASEVNVTEMHRHLELGSFLSPLTRGEVVLGRNLARTLSVGTGDEVIVLTQAADGSLGNDVYTVSGVLRSVGEAVDRGGVIMNIMDLDELLSLNGRIHEVAVRLDQPGSLDEGTYTVSRALSASGLDVRNWRKLFPELDEYLRLSDTSTWIVLVIIFAVASLGIMNTQLMALFERTREIGIMRALGLGPYSVAVMVFLETLFLTLFAAVAGGVVGSLWSSYLHSHGWDLRSVGGSFAFVGVTFDPYLRATLTVRAVAESIAIMIIVAMVATIYPLFRSTRITPVDAIGRGR
ncbi:MAG: ABC transporter permease [bacterium]|nr:MAG: ABC transporter permease [bacterium]